MSVTANQLRVEAALRAHLVSGAVAPGSRLPPFPELATTLGTSVTVLQAVVPRLAVEGLIEVVPRVGSFVRKLPDGAPTGHAGTLIRFQVAETLEWASPAWRRLMGAFEELHPGTRVELAMGDAGADPHLRRPDLLLLNHPEAQARLASGAWRAWGDDATWRVAERSGYCRLLWERTGERRLVPVLLGMEALLAAKGSPADRDAPIADFTELLALCAGEADTYGLVLLDFLAPLVDLGLGSGGIAARRAAAESFLAQLLSTPPPLLVTPPDLHADDVQRAIVSILTERRARCVFGQLWMARIAAKGAWTVRPVPGDGPVGMSAMCLVVPESPRAEAAAELARFIAGAAGQALLAESDALLPTLLAASATHRHAALLADGERRGCQLSAITADPAWRGRWTEAMRVVADLRVGRADAAEALAALLAVDAA